MARSCCYRPHFGPTLHPSHSGLVTVDVAWGCHLTYSQLEAHLTASPVTWGCWLRSLSVSGRKGIRQRFWSLVRSLFSWSDLSCFHSASTWRVFEVTSSFVSGFVCRLNKFFFSAMKSEPHLQMIEVIPFKHEVS